MTQTGLDALLPQVEGPPGGERAAGARRAISLVAAGLAIATLAAAALLISPPADTAGYPGVLPWRSGSWLKVVTDSMGLGGAVRTQRGVEIKDIVFQFAVAALLALLAVRAIVSAFAPPERRTAKGAWFLAQALLTAWVAISAASAGWSLDGIASLGQAALYGFGVAWAIALAWCLEGRDVAKVLWGYVAVAAIAAAVCVWYYHERNPAHRPGFPIGNPSSLAAFLLPAVCIAGFAVVGGAIEFVRGEHRAVLRGLPALVALLPLGWCFWLADSRGAQLGLLVGLLGLAFVLATERMRRWLVGGGLVLAALSVGWLSTHSQDLTMARGATLRFRVYAWQYAATLWGHRPISGLGAGSYPQLSGRLDAYARDRALDPAAFMGDVVEHAHNELFEVFVEIGLIGGLTFVAGWIATLAAASGALQSSLSIRRRWLLLGLIAGLMGQMADAMFGVGLRLPGLAPAFYTLVGVLWAVCRSVSKQRVEDATDPGWLRSMIGRRHVVAGLAGVAAISAGWLAWRNGEGLKWEMDAARTDSPRAALHAAEEAEERLLDPVRRLMSAHRRVVLLSSEALAAFSRVDFSALAAAASMPTSMSSEAAAEAERRCRAAYTAAVELNFRAPSFGRPLELASQTARLLAGLTAIADRKASLEWLERSRILLMEQRRQRPNDIATLLTLSSYTQFGYRFDPGEMVVLLRDALRAGAPPREFHELLRREAARADVRAALATMLAAVGPFNPATELDALIDSYAPEMHRLSGAVRALDGDFAGAATAAATAADLYQPMRARFVNLLAVALGEQAEYEFLAAPLCAERAIATVQRAMQAVPMIQEQKRLELLAPHARNLARYRLAAGDAAGAAEALRAGGVEAERVDAAVEALRADLCRSLPVLCDRVGTQAEQ
jgi:O-antigen ligase